VRVKLVIEVERLGGNKYRISVDCEGDRNACTLLQAKKEQFAKLVIEEMRFAEKAGSTGALTP